MTNQQLQDNLNWLLLRVSLLAKQGLIKLSEEHHLTVMQALTLCLLEPGEAVPMHAISGMLGCDASNVTGIVDRLVMNHYIDRKESDVDRRVNTVSLTDTGKDVRNAFLKKITERQLPTVSTFSEKEIMTLKNLLKKILTDAV